MEYISVREWAESRGVSELRSQDYMRGVMVRKIMRDEICIPIKARTKLEKGDVLTLIGLPQDVAEAVAEIGFSDRPTEATDVIGLGAIQDNLDSTIPAMSYTVTYAVGSILLIFAGMIIPILV